MDPIIDSRSSSLFVKEIILYISQINWISKKKLTRAKRNPNIPIMLKIFEKNVKHETYPRLCTKSYLLSSIIQLSNVLLLYSLSVRDLVIKNIKALQLA